jgi:hypothetical protein
MAQETSNQALTRFAQERIALHVDPAILTGWEITAWQDGKTFFIRATTGDKTINLAGFSLSQVEDGMITRIEQEG